LREGRGGGCDYHVFLWKLWRIVFQQRVNVGSKTKPFVFFRTNTSNYHSPTHHLLIFNIPSMLSRPIQHLIHRPQTPHPLGLIKFQHPLRNPRVALLRVDLAVQPARDHEHPHAAIAETRLDAFDGADLGEPVPGARLACMPALGRKLNGHVSRGA
jgi:hypothetical protein